MIDANSRYAMSLQFLDDAIAHMESNGMPLSADRLKDVRKWVVGWEGERLRNVPTNRGGPDPFQLQRESYGRGIDAAVQECANEVTKAREQVAKAVKRGDDDGADGCRLIADTAAGLAQSIAALKTPPARGGA